MARAWDRIARQLDPRAAQDGAERGFDRIARTVPELPFYVVRASELALLEIVPPRVDPPLSAEWINRGTGQRLRPTTIAMLLRTLGRPCPFAVSVARLHACAGLRLTFATTGERHEFARVWRDLCGQRGFCHTRT